jgi:uncharacterized protein with HEPN domain
MLRSALTHPTNNCASLLISAIEQRTKGITFEEFTKNQTNIKAVLYDFLIIGEATRNVPKEIQSRYPLIP